MVLKFDTIYTYIYVCIDTGLVFFIAFMNTRLDKISCLGPSDLLPTTRSTQIKSATADWLVLILWLWKPIRYYFFFFHTTTRLSCQSELFTFSLQLYTFKNIYKRVGWQREMGGMKKTLIKNNTQKRYIPMLSVLNSRCRGASIHGCWVTAAKSPRANRILATGSMF